MDIKIMSESVSKQEFSNQLKKFQSLVKGSVLISQNDLVILFNSKDLVSITGIDEEGKEQTVTTHPSNILHSFLSLGRKQSSKA